MADHTCTAQMEEFLWRHTEKSEGCWVWTSPSTTSKYRRRMYELVLGRRMSQGTYLIYECGNSRCIKPEHMRMASREEVGQWARLNARKTHCKRGHEFTQENTRFDKRGGQVCCACATLRAAEGRRRKGQKERPKAEVPTDVAILAYAAGIIDGEGSFSIKSVGPKRPQHRLQIRVSSCDRVLISWLIEHFGGHMTLAPRTQRRSTVYGWLLPARCNLVFTDAIRPYLVIKRAQADVAHSFCLTVSMNGPKRITPEVFSLRENLRMEMLRLNGRGRQWRLTAFTEVAA